MNAHRWLLPALLCLAPAFAQATFTSQLANGVITVTGDQAADQFTVTISAGFLTHNQSGPGFVGARDWDTGLAGEQSIQPSICTAISINCGAGADVITLGSTTVDASALCTGDITVNESDSGNLAALIVYVAQDSGKTYTQSSAGLTAPDLAINRPGTFGGGVTVIGGNRDQEFRVVSTFGGEPLSVQAMKQVYIGSTPTAISAPIRITNPPSQSKLTVDMSSTATGRTFSISDSLIGGLTTAPIEYVNADVGTITLRAGTGDDSFSHSGPIDEVSVFLGLGNDTATVGSEFGAPLEVFGDGGDDTFNASGSNMALILEGGNSAANGDRLVVNGLGDVWFDRPGAYYLSDDFIPVIRHTEFELRDVTNALLVQDAYIPVPLGSCPSIGLDPYLGPIEVAGDEHLRYEVLLANRTAAPVGGISLKVAGQPVTFLAGTISAGGQTLFAGCVGIENGGALEVGVAVQQPSISGTAPFAIRRTVPPVEGWLLDASGVLTRRSMADLETVIQTVNITNHTGLMIGIDFHPRTGALYGISQGGQVYLISLRTGVATPVGQPSAAVTTSAFLGIDFDPRTNELVTFGTAYSRILPAAGNSFAVNDPPVYGPDNGIFTGSAAFLTGIAYNRTANLTQLYGMEAQHRHLVSVTFTENVPTVTIESSLPSGSDNAFSFDFASGSDAYALGFNATLPQLSNFYRMNPLATNLQFEKIGELNAVFLGLAFQPELPNTLDAILGIAPANTAADQTFDLVVDAADLVELPP
jgi:hypothetical protein